MKNLFLISSFLFITILGFSQQHEAKLLGICSVNQLQQEPYALWYTQNYSAYNPNAQVLDQLKKTNPSKYTIKIFFGSWCGDSKRELPKMTKVLNEISFAKKSIALIAVDDSTEVYKQSPQREEAGLQIYKVPTFIIYEGSIEIGRIVESPAETIERDLLKIFSKRQYSSNYYTYPLVMGWLKEELLQDENINARGLAFQLKPIVLNESELNSCAYVLMAQANLKEAITIFRINANLFPQSANCYDSLGEAYAKAGLKDKAIQSYEIALQLDPKNEGIQARLRKLKS